MTDENKEKLLMAYKAAVQAGQSTLADLLHDVILGEMGQSPTVTLRQFTPNVAELDNMPLIPTYGNRNVVTCNGTTKEE